MYWSLWRFEDGKPYLENVDEMFVDDRLIFCPDEIIFWADLVTSEGETK